MKIKDKSDSSHAILDMASRRTKANKIIRVLEQKTDLSKARVLDIGTGAGYMDECIAKHALAVTSVDVVDERKTKNGYTFQLVRDECLPFEDESFDVAITNHVIEHVGDQKIHISEVLRVLKPGGIIYLATPNKYWISDNHYRVPFINWMPRKVATMYLKSIRGKEWDVYPTSLSRIKRLTGHGHEVEAVVVDIIKNPEQYKLDAFKKLHRFIKWLPRRLLQPLSILSPTLLLVIRKEA